jgi:uncharacterized protein YcbK (DUF882 family)
MAASTLIDRLRAEGIVAPRIAIEEAKRAGLPLELACALLEKESGGGRNVYGHDPSIFRGAGAVTRENYAAYRKQRIASGNRSMQGVGPCQLTWWEFQDQADAQGGCWRPRINMRVGFLHLANLIKRYGQSDGARRYNGSGAAAEAYSRDLLVKARRWESLIDGLEAAPKIKRRRKNAVESDRAARNGKPHVERDGAERRPGRPTPTRVTVLAHEFRQQEDEADRAWRALVAYGHRRRRRLLAEKAEMEARAGGLSGEELKQLLAALARIEEKLGTLVDLSQAEPHTAGGEAPAEGPAPVPEPPAPAAVASATGGVATAELTQPAAVAPQPALGRPLKAFKAPELLREIKAQETRTRELREELIGRYEVFDDELARLLGTSDEPPRRSDGGRRRRRLRDDADRPSRGERDPLGGKVVDTTLGDRGVFVRRSKIALARYLAKKGNAEHAGLRRTLRREAATPSAGGKASPAWARAVRAAQHIAGRPVTGELDGELTQLLLPYWPRDNAVKRIVRSTPGWRAIPGQLTPNFNVKEFACKDKARTPYIKGLMNEQGLSKKEARARAKGLADRLERVRKLSGDRPIVITSAFRTKAYNASLSGSATNSAHTRGYAVDVPPPRGISLDQHKQHMMQAFECGIGYYPMGRGYFIHGDFDKSLGGRRVW